ncbi:hypothetical protein DLAC_08734 [Tieghemostelium lacteum]|uniref:Uncharacterized protein n=1 Tax=Tieghemostelium lacteum TaxID=361077 RepID=A0A151Z848_TIELA|nr:hypothetical protein DLAC_08734 [Tieghemostelium lacteum]|eukprot:KYQ90146.1 hypothetical protein DLAC_08734 [Tieghemostelium lacteum]
MDDNNNKPGWATNLFNQLQRLEQKIDNMSLVLVITTNRQNRSFNSTSPRNVPPSLLLKDTEGCGNFPGLRHAPTLNPIAEIGSTPNIEINSFNDNLTNNQLSYLSRFYNNNFGIDATTTIEHKRILFYNWIEHPN